MPASLDDILTAMKNIVTALNTQTTNSTNLAGVQDFVGITSTTLVKATAGRIARISVIAAGSSTGAVHDSNTVSFQPATSIYVINNAVGIQIVDLPVQYGIVIVPGSGMSVSVSYS